MRVLSILLLASLACSALAQAPPTEASEVAVDPTYGGTCQEGASVSEVLLPRLKGDLAKFTALNWPHYDYTVAFVRGGAPSCPLTVQVQNGRVASVDEAQLPPQQPGQPPCSPASEEARAALQQLTVTALMQELVLRAPGAHFLCWAPHSEQNGAMGTYVYHAAGTQPSAEDTELFISNLKQTARRRLGVLGGAAIGALEGCIAGAIFAGNCGGGAAAGATVGAISGAFTPYGGYGPYGPPGPYGPYPPGPYGPSPYGPSPYYGRGVW